MEFNRAFGPRGRNITSAYKVMRNQLLALAPADAKPMKVSDREKEAVRQAVRSIMWVATSESISQYFRDFTEGYLPLADNWNRQLVKDRTISVQVAACQRILADMMTMKDTMEVMRGATKRLEQLVRYKPAAFDLSRHYLLTLQKDIEKKTGSKKEAVVKGEAVKQGQVGVQQC